METSITLEFADGEYHFALGLRQINEIQNVCDMGIGAVFARVARGIYHRKSESGEVVFGDPLAGDWDINYLTAIIRQGLIGGGRGTVDGEAVTVDATRANQLIENYVLAQGCDFASSWKLAYTILAGRIVGFQAPDGADLDKKKDAETTG